MPGYPAGLERSGRQTFTEVRASQGTEASQRGATRRNHPACRTSPPAPSPPRTVSCPGRARCRSGMPASSRSVSRAARPAGTGRSPPADGQRFPEADGVSEAGQNSSKPSSPVYPVRAARAGTPADVAEQLRRNTSWASRVRSVSGARIARPRRAPGWRSAPVVVGRVGDRRVETGGPGTAARRKHHRRVRGVGDDQEPILLALPVHQPGRRARRRSPRRSSCTEPGQGRSPDKNSGQRVVQRLARRRARSPRISPMCERSNRPGRVPHRLVLGRLAAVAQWHLPAGEGGHDQPAPRVLCRQRSLPR